VRVVLEVRVVPEVRVVSSNLERKNVTGVYAIKVRGRLSSSGRKGQVKGQKKE
jgi:hypothetical protein